MTKWTLKKKLVTLIVKNLDDGIEMKFVHNTPLIMFFVLSEKIYKIQGGNIFKKQYFLKIKSKKYFFRKTFLLKHSGSKDTAFCQIWGFLISRDILVTSLYNPWSWFRKNEQRFATKQKTLKKALTLITLPLVFFHWFTSNLDLISLFILSSVVLLIRPNSEPDLSIVLKVGFVIFEGNKCVIVAVGQHPVKTTVSLLQLCRYYCQFGFINGVLRQAATI